MEDKIISFSLFFFVNDNRFYLAKKKQGLHIQNSKSKHYGVRNTCNIYNIY